jgi:uncharacterized protein YggT (Ycf19 family)
MILAINVINTVISVYSLAIVLRVFLEMLLGPYQVVVVFLRRITEPVLGPIRRHVPALQAGGAAWDLSPVVALILLWALGQIVTRLLLLFVR